MMGRIRDWLDQALPPKPTWSVDEIPDMTGKVAIVTGGNSGAGEESVKELLKKNATVYMAARSQQKADESIKRLELETGRRAHFLQLDLADLVVVKRAGEEFIQKEQRLDVLINNGGVMIPPDHLLTAQGYDMQFGTNVIGHFEFTKLLLPLLLASFDGLTKPRVVNVSSGGYSFHKKISYDAMRDGRARRKLSGLTRYGHSKFGNIVLAVELAKRHGDRLTVTSLHPGTFHSGLTRHASGNPFVTIFMYLFGYPRPYGALTMLWAATSPQTADMNGKYLIPWARLGVVPPEALEPGVSEKLWDWLEEQVKDV